MAPEILDVLIELSKRREKVTTSKLAGRLGSSQQTISRKIRYLEDRGLIHRTPRHKGQLVKVTDKGLSFMRKKYLDLRDIIERSDEPSISFGGNLVQGSGEGRYYVSQEKYFTQFHDRLGFRPFFGTLNIRMRNVHDLKAKSEMEKTKPVMVRGFRKGSREFGNIHCYPCIVNRKARGAVVVPERTHHPIDVIEIIAPVDLRKSLGIKESDYVHVELRA